MEPVERGIKVWECADSSTVMFVISMFTLRGSVNKSRTRSWLSHCSQFNKAFCWQKPSCLRGNFFSLIPLAEKLLHDQIYLCRVFKSTRHTKGDCLNNARSETALTRRVCISSERQFGRHCVEG